MAGHAYAIYAQQRRYVQRGDEWFIVPVGAPERMLQWSLFPSRKAAQRMIMEIVNAPDWEHRNPHAAHYFYWAKRVELTRKGT